MNNKAKLTSRTTTITTNTSLIDQYQADLESVIDSFVTPVDSLASNQPSTLKQRHIISPLVTFDRDPAATTSTEHLNDELRWLLIQYGPHQPRDNEDQFLASAISTHNGKGNARFRSKWFDDPRFCNWLEYSLTTDRAYCFYCRLFVESNRNRAFSRDGIKNWRKCLGSRGQKKKRVTETSLRSNENLLVSQRRGLLESHGMSVAHKQAYEKYLTFVNRMLSLTKLTQNNNEAKESSSSSYEVTRSEAIN